MNYPEQPEAMEDRTEHKEPADILVIDDDRGVTKTLSAVISRMGHRSVCAHSIAEGMEAIREQRFDAVFLDVQLPDGSGLDIISHLKTAPSAPQVVIITSYANPDGAEIAIQNGAWDFLEKPLSIQRITLLLVRVLKFQEQRRVRQESALFKRSYIIGNSPQVLSCVELAARAAASEANVLITGETGTGKELFAKAIHDNSSRSGENFVVVDCGVLSETMVESVLFGHEKGAYTGADRAREGLVRLADKGTLFLDEVGELPGTVQASFLRVLQEHRFRPMGNRKEIPSDFRVISATNRNLEELVASGCFRKDLMYRLGSIAIDLPPLRQRKADILDLAAFFMKKLCDTQGLLPKEMSPEFQDILMGYAWPGNVRELANAMENAMAAAQNEQTLIAQHLPLKIRIEWARNSVGRKAEPILPCPEHQENPEPLPDLQTLVARTEKQYFTALVTQTRGDIKAICDISGLSRAMVYSRLKKYGISRQSP